MTILMFSNNPFSAKIKAVSDEIVSQSRCWTNAQVVKTGVVDQMTMCQAADGCTVHMSKCSKFSILLHVFTDAVTSEPQTTAVI